MTDGPVTDAAGIEAAVTDRPLTDGGRPVRVLWLAKGLGLGGAERLLLNCARHVDRERFEVEVAYVLPWKDALAPDLEKAGIPVHLLTGAPGRRGRDPLWPLRLRSLMAQRRYGLVHTHMPVPAVAARMLLRGPLSVPLVHTEHNMWQRYRLPTRIANSWTYGRNAAVVAVSRAVAASVRPPRRVDPGQWLNVVHHGPDLGGAAGGAQARAEAREALGLPREGVVVGTVGNLTAKKDQRTLLDAFALMRRNHPEAALVLIGSGPLEERLRRHASSLGLDGTAVFAGSRPDVPALLPALDVFTLSSRQEGLPVALMEAMASGLPSVVTRVGGMPEIVDQGVEGLLVQPGDAEALSVALGRLVGGPALRARMSAAARERARRFDAEGAQRRIEAVYEQVLAGRRSTGVTA
ncbi:glycosyltransferase [Wenjunlia tyrosinilytica]|uniref:glycosyltransferase n=1 Tax=Wenjunlia tyrosinilytica TaxID=1544741 RepID=UPI001E428796|nr:glycosyltransferase [Wenjunlia tyrosinilytica]